MCQEELMRDAYQTCLPPSCCSRHAAHTRITAGEALRSAPLSYFCGRHRRALDGIALHSVLSPEERTLSDGVFVRDTYWIRGHSFEPCRSQGTRRAEESQQEASLRQPPRLAEHNPFQVSQSLIASLDVLVGSPLHLNSVAAGLTDLLLAERADHWRDLLIGGCVRPTKMLHPGSHVSSSIP